MLREVEQAEADGRDALDALVRESDALKARKAAAGERRTAAERDRAALFAEAERALQRTQFWAGHIWAGRLTFVRRSQWFQCSGICLGFESKSFRRKFLTLTPTCNDTSKGVRTLEGNVDTGVLSANLRTRVPR